MKAIILAGSQGDSPLKDINRNKALIKIHDKEMVLYVVDALKKLDFIEKVALVGEQDELLPLKDHVDTIIDGSDSMTQNILKGANCFSDEEFVLILTSDIPMITSEAIRDFVEKAQKLDGEFFYPIVEKECNEKKYPGVKRTYVKIKDGTFTGGNIFLVRAGVLKTAIYKAESFLTNRKKPWKLAHMLGISFIIKFLLGSLTIAELEKRVSGIFGAKAQAIKSPYPEIGTDVDKKSDLMFAKTVLGGL